MKNELNKVESMIYMKYFGDGLWDIFIGFVYMIFGLGIMLDLPYLAGITVPLAYTVIKQLKMKITVPRIGYIQFKQTRKRLVVLILAGLLLLGMIFFTIFMKNRESPLFNWLRANFYVAFGLVFGGVLAVTGYLTHSPRFYAYSGVAILLLAFTNIIGSLGLNIAASGGLIVLAGCIVLFRFLVNYPLDGGTEGADNAG